MSLVWKKLNKDIPSDKYEVFFSSYPSREAVVVLKGLEHTVEIKLYSGFYKFYKKSMIKNKPTITNFRKLLKSKFGIYYTYSSPLIDLLNKIGFGVFAFKDDLVHLVIVADEVVVECMSAYHSLIEISMEKM